MQQRILSRTAGTRKQVFKRLDMMETTPSDTQGPGLARGPDRKDQELQFCGLGMPNFSGEYLVAPASKSIQLTWDSQDA